MRPGRMMWGAGVLALIVGACAPGPVKESRNVAPASSPSDTSAVASPRPAVSSPGGGSNPLAPPSAHTPGPAVASDLVFTGTPSGRARSAQSLGPCGRGAAGFAASLRFVLGASPYVLSLDIVDYHGAGRYTIPPERVAVRSDVRSGTPTFLPATAGMVDVDAGEGSGRVDAALGSGAGSHLSGTWACR